MLMPARRRPSHRPYLEGLPEKERGGLYSKLGESKLGEAFRRESQVRGDGTRSHHPCQVYRSNPQLPVTDIANWLCTQFGGAGGGGGGVGSVPNDVIVGRGFLASETQS